MREGDLPVSASADESLFQRGKIRTVLGLDIEMASYSVDVLHVDTKSNHPQMLQVSGTFACVPTLTNLPVAAPPNYFPRFLLF